MKILGLPMAPPDIAKVKGTGTAGIANILPNIQ